MANIDLYMQKLIDIANAIRVKLKETDKYKLEEMPEKILSITGGGSSDPVIIVESIYQSEILCTGIKLEVNMNGFTEKVVIPTNIVVKNDVANATYVTNSSILKQV